MSVHSCSIRYFASDGCGRSEAVLGRASADRVVDRGGRGSAWVEVVLSTRRGAQSPTACFLSKVALGFLAPALAFGLGRRHRSLVGVPATRPEGARASLRELSANGFGAGRRWCSRPSLGRLLKDCGQSFLFRCILCDDVAVVACLLGVGTAAVLEPGAEASLFPLSFAFSLALAFAFGFGALHAIRVLQFALAVGAIAG